MIFPIGLFTERVEVRKFRSGFQVALAGYEIDFDANIQIFEQNRVVTGCQLSSWGR